MDGCCNLVLAGFMGTGKSVIGRRVAAMTRRPFLDMDAEIETRAGKRISRIFAEDGEAAFRDLESALAAEWGKYNINVNCISPSYTLSPARRRDTKQTRDTMRSLHPMGWYERPADLQGTLVYLASDASNYVTGRDIMVDGGHTLSVWLEPLTRAVPPRQGAAAHGWPRSVRECVGRNSNAGSAETATFAPWNRRERWAGPGRSA